VVKRCAIYTRKSSEEGLEQDFNSLHAQREACEAYIKSQKHEGWQIIKAAYDDGGISGGTMERPALQRLLEDIRHHKIDIVVVYKVDQLTRSLSDFAKIVDLFDDKGVSFVSVTQQFNTTSSMGRLTLNVLLSFAQFEREVTGERIRDKIAASKKKGIWMGGPLPLGYEVKDRKLLITPQEAETVRYIYQRYLALKCVRVLHRDLAERGIRSARGHILSRGTLYNMLSNPIYLGQIAHKGHCYPGQHEAIVEKALWERVQHHIASNRVGNKSKTRKTDPSPLAGKLFDASGERLVPVHAKKEGRRYRYYVSRSLTTGIKASATSGWRLPALELEHAVAQAINNILEDREAIVSVLHEADVALYHVETTLKVANESDASILITQFIQRVELQQNEMRLVLSLSSLLPANHSPITLTRDVPLKMKRRGVEMRMIIGDTTPTKVDPILIRTLARAHAWYDDFVSGRVTTLAEIATRHNIDKGDVSRVVNLAFLAPDIVEDIIAGRQPADLTAQKLLRNTCLPLEWAEQRRALDYN
jgi:site-specific DNA recombinase